jgi:hypothetical protein
MDGMDDLLLPKRTKPYMAIAIPSSIVSEEFDLRERTRKVGYIGRAAAIFRVEDIVIYIDDDAKNAEFVKDVLTYLEAPPYLKKRLVKLNPNLRFVGVLPPLKAVHHVPHAFGLNIREGVVIDVNEVRSIIYVGLEKKVIVYQPLTPGKRVVIKIEKELEDSYIGKVINKEVLDWYWGYKVKVYSSIKEMFEKLSAEKYRIICASKKGIMIYEAEERLRQIMRETDKIITIFGGPKLDVDEIASLNGVDANKYCEETINFIPRQGVESVRTEEAIYIVLSILNYLKERPIT